MPKKKVSDLINFFNNVSDEHPNGIKKVKSKVKDIASMFEPKVLTVDTSKIEQNKEKQHKISKSMKPNVETKNIVEDTTKTGEENEIKKKSKKIKKSKKVKKIKNKPEPELKPEPEPEPELKPEPEPEPEPDYDSDDSLARDLAEL